MKSHRAHSFVRLAVAACAAAATFSAMPVIAQHVPGVKGSLDAVTVLPTGPAASSAAATQPTVIPAGHPQIMKDATPPTAALHGDMGAAKTGALRVVVSQGTKLGPPIGKDSARVELLSQGVAIKTYLTQVDDKGIIELHDLPLDVPFQPVITIVHDGAEQQRVGAVMHKYQPAIEFDMPVYEITTQKPAWTIGLRDIETQVVTAQGGGTDLYVRFTDMIGGFNPEGRAWTGESVGGVRQTLAIALPAEAVNVQFGPGMAEAGPKVVNHTVIRGKTMLPGSTEYMIAYDVPVKAGRARVTFTAPADTSLFALYVPGEWTVEKTEGLEGASAGGTHATGKSQLLKAKVVKAGELLSVEFSGIKPPPPPATKPAEADHTTDLHLPIPSGKK